MARSESFNFKRRSEYTVAEFPRCNKLRLSEMLLWPRAGVGGQRVGAKNDCFSIVPIKITVTDSTFVQCVFALRLACAESREFSLARLV